MTRPFQSACAAAALAFLPAVPALAQEDAPIERPASGTVFDGDWLTIGIGGVYGPSYEGSDDYVLFPVPMVQGNLAGIAINARAAGVALDFIPDPDQGLGFNLGVNARLRSNRAQQIKDPVVKSLGKLDRAVEVGPTAGITYRGLLNAYDNFSVNVDVGWDVAGAHKGMVVSPSISYFTPVSRGMAAGISVNAQWADKKYNHYYFSVSPADALISGLPAYDGRDSGFTRAGVNLFTAIDLDGDLADGGLSLVVLGGYSKMLGDAKRTPFTSIRGDADQWVVGAGVAYTF